MMKSFTYRRSGSTGCEIIDPDGTVVAWAVDAGWAVLIVELLNGAGFPRPAPFHHLPGGQGPVEASDERKGRLWAEATS